MSNTVPQGFSQTSVTPLLRRWGVVVAAGVVLAVVGVLLLANISDAARVLAILVAIGLFLQAVDEVAQAERYDRRWPSYVLAAVWVITGVVALVWPGITLWVLAAMVGIGLIVGGLAEFALVYQYRRELPSWGLYLLDGAVSVVIGVCALAWPRATVVVLAILFGIRILFRGLATIMFGLNLRRLHKMPTLS